MYMCVKGIRTSGFKRRLKIYVSKRLEKPSVCEFAVHSDNAQDVSMQTCECVKVCECVCGLQY